jgi:hypothetical protein
MIEYGDNILILGTRWNILNFHCLSNLLYKLKLIAQSIELLIGGKVKK